VSGDANSHVSIHAPRATAVVDAVELRHVLVAGTLLADAASGHGTTKRVVVVAVSLREEQIAVHRENRRAADTIGERRSLWRAEFAEIPWHELGIRGDGPEGGDSIGAVDEVDVVIS